MIKFARSAAGWAGLIALAAGWLIFGGAPAQAAEDFYTFKSMLSSPSASWCIDAPEFKSGTQVLIAACSDRPNQIFGYESGGSLSVGGYCLDDLPANPGQPPSAGDSVGLAVCDGSDHQAWNMQTFKDRPDVFAIANPDGLCVTVEDATIKEGSPLGLAQCADLPTQGWLRGHTASVEPEYYWYSGHRYCWYDQGWHGPGWYWCEENLHVGIGWGGPIGWHWWHHHGHPPHPHPHPLPHPLPPPVPHPHPGLHPHVVLHPHVMPHPFIAPHPHLAVHPHGVPHPHGPVRPHRP